MMIRNLPWLLLIVAFAAHALPPAPTPDEAARDVEHAHRSDNAGALRTLASRDDPDPWQVADVLCAQDRYDIAAAFVMAAPRLDTAKLTDAIEALRKAPPSAEDRALLAAALASTDPAEQLGKLNAIEIEGKGLFGARVLAARAEAADTPEAHRAVAAAASSIGWLSLAARSEARAAALYERSGKLTDAVAAARDRLEVEALRGSAAQLADALLEAGRLSLIVSELPEAEDLLRRAMRQAQRTADKALEARSTLMLGRTMAARGSLQDARLYLLMAVGKFRDLEDEANVLAALAPVVELDLEIDGVAPALQRAEEALALARKLEDRATEGRMLTLKASMEAQRKDWTTAVIHYDAAEAAFRAAGVVGGAGEAAYSSGVLSLRMGRRDAARGSLTRAEADADAAKDEGLQAKVQSALGDLSLELGQVEQAARHLQAAAKLAATSNNPSLAARSLSRLGRLALRQGNAEEARTRLVEALQQLRQVKDVDDEVRTLLALGEAERRLGQRDRARELADEVLAIARRDQLPGVLARAAALRGLSVLTAETDPVQAAAAFEPLRLAAREVIAMHESLKLASTPRFEADLDRLMGVGVDVALASNDVSLLLRVCEYRRSRAVLAALGGREALLSVLTSRELQELRDKTVQAEIDAVAEYERARNRMEKIAMLDARTKVQKTRAELAAVDKRIEEHLAAAKSLLAPEAVAIESVQLALAPSESLLYYCAGVESIGVAVITRGTSRMLALGARREIEEMTTALHAALRKGEADEATARVREALYTPLGIADSLRDLVIVPVAPVDRVPFCIIDNQATVRYSGTAASAVHTAVMAGDKGVGVLGIGNTSFAGDAVRIRVVHLANGIPVRRLEVGRKLSEVFEDVVIVGPPANETEVLTAIGSRPRWQAIHFSTPFLVDGMKPYASLMGLAPENGDDGLLDLHELMRFGLRTELAVLAACEPSKSSLDSDAAVRAIARGLHLAGSTRVIASQWWMDDGAATTLMSNFYRYWQNRETPAPLALRRAQSKVTESPGWAPPKYWAGWQLWGAR